jgi:broad specificity phosphatase PhoE
MLDLYLIRHGESENNKYHSHVVGGISKDTDLTEEGMMQAELLGKRLKDDVKFDKILSSIAVRASKTCDIACSIAGYNINDIIRSERLFETDRGEMVGLKREHAKAFFSRPDIDSWTYIPKDGESNQMAAQRMHDFLKEHLDDFQYHGTVAVFGHGNIFRAFLKTVMGYKEEYVQWDKVYNMPIENTSIAHLQYDGNVWNLKRWNDIGHLK